MKTKVKKFRFIAKIAQKIACLTACFAFSASEASVAKVGDTEYETLGRAFAALSSENYTLTLQDTAAWPAETPVHWAAGTQSGYAATLAAALTAAYKADAGAITVVCRPGADVGTMTHGHVADDLTIYGNNAYLSGGECDLEVDSYTFSRATGAQATDGAYLAKDITITAYELDNLGVWGQRHTAHKVTVNLTDCDGKGTDFNGNGNLQRVYISGTTGVNDITLTDCDFLTKATAVYSNADGAITAVNCSFTDGQVPFNINHKANGTQTVAVENCRFTNCGDVGDWKQFAAPLRLVNSGTGTQSAEVTGCAFAGTVGANGDILLGDGRTGQASNDVELKVVKTAANIQAQKPGYYGGATVDATKKATAESPAEGTLETSVAKLLPVNDGSEAHPYSREQFAAMTRAEYSAAQERLGGTLYVNVGNYAYRTDGVLGNGVRNDTPGQVPDHSKLNAYGENGYLGGQNDGANGHAVVFVGGTITSGVTGYKDIDQIGTSLLLAVPAYTKVTFKGTAFKNVLSFDYQLYTSPWSQLGGLAFEGCTFDGIIVGAIASQELAFTGCAFNNYVNTMSANSSNPTWIRPAYGNWTPSDNEGQGTDFRSLTKITFENNTVTSTRPVKFERIAQWEVPTTVTATGNTFDIKPQEGDTSTKNVGLYFGANAKFDLVIDNNKKNDATAALYTAVYKAPTETTYDGLPAGSTVKNAAGEDVASEDAFAWKTTDTLTLKTTEEVASVGVVKFATLAEAALAAADAGETVTLLADITHEGSQLVIAADKRLTLDLNGKTLKVSKYTAKAAQVSVLGNLTVTDGSAAQTGVICSDYTGTAGLVVCVEKDGALTMKGGRITTEGMAKAGNAVKIATGGTVEMTGGTIACDAKRNNVAVNLAGSPSRFTMTGGSVVADNGESSTAAILAKSSGSTLAISDAAKVSGPTAVSAKSAATTISGGAFEGTISANKGVSGGTFDREVPLDACTDYHESLKNEDGTYGIFPFTAIDIKTSIDGAATVRVRVSRSLLDRAGGASFEEQVANLGKQETNGNLAWVNGVMGLEADKAVHAVDVPQNENTKEDGVFIQAPVPVPKNSDAVVSYSIDEVDAGGRVIKAGTEQTSGSLKIVLADIETSARFRVNVFVRSNNGTTVAKLVSENTVGVLKTATSAKKAIIAVPWLSLADGGNISVLNLVKTAGLTKGDRLHVYNKAEKRYDVYELAADRAWMPKAIYKIGADGTVEAVSSGTPETTTVARGNGVWLERQDTAKAIVSYGQVASGTVATTIDAGTAETPTWNLLAVPTTTAVDVAATFGASEADTLIVPTAGAPKICTVKDGAWGYEKAVSVTDKFGNTAGVKVVRETVAELPAGTGFWYLNGGVAKTVNW